MKNRIKICLVTSRGGHLFQLFLLKKWWDRYDRFWITSGGTDVDDLLINEKLYRGFFPESRNYLNAIKNFILGVCIIKNEKPNIVVSCGAGIAPPILLAGKFLGCRTIFIDSVSFVKYPSLSAKISSLFVDKVLTQHKNITNKLCGSLWWGSVL
jgi:beta-1,4-N-acetylglucosaminyltransferase